MTDLVEIAVIASVPPTIAALGALGLGVLNHVQGNKIHVLVNSKMTEVVNALAAAKAENAVLTTALDISQHPGKEPVNRGS